MRSLLRILTCCAYVATATTTLWAQSAHDQPQSVADLARALLDRIQNPIVIATVPADIERGGKLFVTHCASCHGPGGEGGRGPTLAQPTLARAQDDESLLAIIQRGIEGSEMPRSRLERSEIGLVAGFVKSLGSKPVETVIGDPQRGAIVYATKGQCATCHAINGRGGAFGPDLSDIGRRRSAAHLRRALTDPNADVPQSFNAFRSDVMLPQNFLYVRAVTRDGTHIDGVRVNEDTFSIQIREATGRIHSLIKADLKQLSKDVGKSPMPSYKDALSPAEIDDLVAYMVSLREVTKS